MRYGYGLPPSYTLIIAEKPRAAEKIAKALDPHAVKGRLRGVPYWVIRWNGRPAVVASAAGHLYSLYTDRRGWPVFEYRWVPRYVAEPGSSHTKRFLEALKVLAQRAHTTINACDYDIEGSVIGYLIIKFLLPGRRVFRAKFSSLTRSEILRAFRSLGSLDHEMVEAGLCRHELDWMWGINVSRAISDLMSDALGKKVILSAGRVQSPTLLRAVTRIIERRLFVPLPRFYPRVQVRVGNKLLGLEYDDEPFTSRSSAAEFVKCIREEGYVRVTEVRIEEKRVLPPHPFNLPDLQKEAGQILRFSPYTTQKLAEDLYLEALISYPRTNSQKLPPTLDNRGVLKALSRNPRYRSLIASLLLETRGILRPNNGPSYDPAHPAIYPTGEGSAKRLSKKHLALYDLIVRRYLATFAQPAVLRSVTVYVSACGRRFRISTLRVVREGWYRYYPYHRPREGEGIPQELLKRGAKIPVAKASYSIRYTKPPPPPTRLELLRWMESVGIGTESTRAEIIEVLFRRGYVVARSGRIDVSDLGLAVASLLQEFFPQLVEVELTRRFEEYVEAIRARKLRCREVVEEAKKVISGSLERFRSSYRKALEEVPSFIPVAGAGDRCRLCGRRAVSRSLCRIHLEAYRRVVEAYEEWRRAGFSKEEYLDRIRRLKSVGQYIREVVEALGSEILRELS
ncbi:MAG: DNA topoisomerase I [Thermoprotei archaeon]|nr:MAG: DNA topoisomerase I [Thermoprotei archaeon]